nr:unnamed protein product [Spirometra erinaceieuropaei]
MDYFFILRRDQRDVLVTKEIPGADRWADHRLTISEIRIRLEHRRRPQDKHPRAHHLHFSNDLAQRLANLPVAADEDAPMKNQWCQLRDTVQSTALVVLGRAGRQHQNRFDYSDAAIGNLLAEKNRLHKAFIDLPTGHNRTAVYRHRPLVKHRLCGTQDACRVLKTEEIQGYTERDEWKSASP